jgi:hypothetical protein
MDGITLSTAVARPDAVPHNGAATRNLVEQAKDVRRLRLNREVLADPSMAKKLVSIEASPAYNAKAELIPSVASAALGQG